MYSAMRSRSWLLISAVLLLLLCEAAVATEKGSATATIEHRVRLTYSSHKERDGIVQALLARWKSILAQPEFGRTATDIKLRKGKVDNQVSKGRVAVYAVIYNKANKKNLPVLVGKAKAAVDASLGQRPIPGVSALATPSSTNTRSLMAFDTLE